MSTSPALTDQGAHPPTFAALPLNHDMSIPQLYEYHARNSPDHPVFTYSDPETHSSHNVTYREAWDCINQIARTISYHHDGQVSHKNSQNCPIVGILVICDTLSYIYLIVAIMRLGYTVFPLSPLSNPVVIAHLLESTGTTRLIVSSDGPMQSLAHEAAEIVADKGIYVETLTMPQSSAASSTNLTLLLPPVDTGEGSDVCMIVHSSGTTGLPKPVYLTRTFLNQSSTAAHYGEVDLLGKRIAGHTNPITHAMGVTTLLLPLHSGATVALYKPSTPPVVPTPINYLSTLTADRCNIVYCVPAFIEAWAHDPANIPTLKALDSIIFCGASIKKPVGDKLVQARVTLHAFWGSTEMGGASMLIPRDAPSVDQWEYFKLSKHMNFVLRPQADKEGLFEPLVTRIGTCSPPVTNCEFEGSPAFTPGDLLERHPTDSSRWRVYGRKGDQIGLSNGGSVNPVPTEAIIVQDPDIASAIMFGHQHMNTGILIEPASGTHNSLEFIEIVRRAVQNANLQIPEFARIARNMIIITSPDKPLQRTSKGTPRRSACLALYRDEIEKLYACETDAVAAGNRLFLENVA